MTQSHWFRIDDGKIIEHWANRGDLGMARHHEARQRGAEDHHVSTELAITRRRNHEYLVLQ